MKATSVAPIPAASAQEAAAAQLILRLSAGYIASAAMHVVIDLGIADRLASGPRPVADLATETGVSADALSRVMHALASVGVFREATPGLFALTPAAALLCHVPGSLLGPARWMTEPLHLKVFAELSSVVRTGEPATERVLQQPLFDALADDPRLSQTFNDAMTGMTVAVDEAIVRSCSFIDAAVVVDVGGGEGALLAAILVEWPHLRGILFDRSHVVGGADALLATEGIRDRSSRVSGNFFQHVPAGGDVYLLKNIVHDWPDERVVDILRNVRAALDGNPRGRLLVIEDVIDAVQGPSVGKFMDLSMMVLVGGRERTKTQFAALLARGGFALECVTPTRSSLSVIEARPR
jgi:hypothetical protein